MASYTLEEKCNLLANCRLFRNIHVKTLEPLARYAKTKSLKNREVICHRGDIGSQMYVIAKGKVSIHTDSDEGKELGFGFMNEGDVFGEIAMLDGGERTATVKAIEQTEILVIERRDFIPFIEKEPKVAVQLLTTLAARLRSADEHFEDIFFRNLPGRLAKKFLGLAEEYGHDTGNGIQIDLKLSQGEIGKLTGATRESINKQMRAWEIAGLIGCKKGFVTIKDPEALEDISELA
ncbi:MAG TPA: Crp/Fnr family transcriptional regulator [Gammaproteobacteria bacterium]|nr:Crp/Fnr family transcriptional regulator [Gammaproteobacteria bacterium]